VSVIAYPREKLKHDRRKARQKARKDAGEAAGVKEQANQVQQSSVTQDSAADATQVTIKSAANPLEVKSLQDFTK
jgi:hypothetical protein